MEKIIKYGFQPIINTLIRGQNDIKGKKLHESGHVFDVVEKKLLNGLVTITADVVAQTSVSKTYNVKITLDDQRNTSNAVCKCKAGLAGKCKHICAVVYYVNSPDSADSKTNHGQEWGKPSRRQLLEYEKGVKISKLFTPPPYTDKNPKVVPLKLESLVFPEDMSGCPLCTMINIDKRDDSEIIAAESLVALVKVNDKRDVESKVRFDTTPSELTKLNRLTTSIIFPRQQLYVPVRSSNDSEQSESTQSEDLHDDLPLEEKELLDNLRPVSPKPGHAERVRTPSYNQASIPEQDEDATAYTERFLRINVRHITDGQGVVSGVLLVTPNAVMFDPNVSDLLVIEHGPEAYGVIAPMEFFVNVAIYHDIAHMRVGHVEGTAGEKPEIYYAKHTIKNIDDHEPDSLMVKDETFPELVAGDDAESVCSSTEREGEAFPKAFDRDLVTPTNLNDSEHPQHSLEERRKSLLDHHWAIPSKDRSLDEEGSINTPNLLQEEHEDESEDESFVKQSCHDSGIDIRENSTSSIVHNVATKKKYSDADIILSKDWVPPLTIAPTQVTTTNEIVSPARKKTSSVSFSLNSTGDPLTLPFSSSLPDGKNPDSRKNKMLKRLSYPLAWMETLTGEKEEEKSSQPSSDDSSHHGSMFSKVFSSSPKNLVDFGTGLFLSKTPSEESGGSGGPCSGGSGGPPLTPATGITDSPASATESSSFFPSNIISSMGASMGATVGAMSASVGGAVGATVGGAVGAMGGAVEATVGAVGATVGAVGSTVGAVGRSSVGTFMRQPTENSKPSKILPPKLDYRSMVSVDDMPELFVSFDKSSEEDDSEDWDDDLLPPRKRRKIKRKPKKPIPKEDIASPSKIDIRNNLLAEWEEDSETEVDDNAITSSANIEDSDTSMNKTDDTVQSIDINNESISNLENKESNKSCFDFEEDDTEIVGTSVGRKIPRILPPSKPLISDVENDDSGLSDIISCPMESVEEKDKDDKTDVEHETKKSELNDPDVNAFQDILNVTNVPSLPEVPHSLKFEQNFHNAKTIKFPDKSSIEEESNALACETEVLQKQSSEESIDQFDIQDFKSKKNLEVLEMEVDDVVRPSVEELTETLSKQDVEVEIAPMTDLKEIAEVDAQNNSSKVELKSEAKDKLAIVNKFGSDDLNEVSGTEVQKLGTSLNKSPVKEVVMLPSKLINPKKRFVKSFEDFEQQLNNEQRKLMENETTSSEELTMSPVLTKLIEVTTTNVVPKENPVVEDLEIKKSGVEFSKLKTQLKSKLESTSDSYQSEVIKVKRDRTFEKRKSREYLESRSKKSKLLFESLLHEEHSTSEDSLQEVAIVTSPIISNISKVQEAEDVKMSESKSPFSNISKVQEAEDVKMSESNKDVHSESNFENRSENENVILDLVTENRTAVNKDAAEAPKQSNQLDLEPSITTESSPIVKTEANDIETSSTSSIVSDNTVINKNLEIQSDTGDLSALSALAAVSELSTSLTVHSVEEDKPKAINQSLDFLESTNESCELKLTEGNLTYFTESDLVDSQVEIVNLSPVKEKCKPVTLSTFSVDFTDSEDKDVQVPKCEANKFEKSKPIEKDSILDFMKSEFQSSDSSASEDNISNILPLHSAPPVQDYGSSKLLEILSEGKEQDTTSSIQRCQSGQKPSSGQRSYSKVEMSPSINKDYSKSVLKNEPKNIKFFSKSGISEKATSSTIKSGKPIILSNQIIKSTSDVETVSVQKVSSKKTNQGFDFKLSRSLLQYKSKEFI